MRRITPATVTVGVLFAFVGLVGAYVVKDGLRAKPLPLVNNVMVAAADLPAGTVLTANDVGRTNLPRNMVPAGTVMDRQSLVGRRLREPVKGLQPFTGNLFYAPGAGPTLSTRLKPGFRAVTIEAAPASAGLGGLARPGDVVDVLLTLNPDSNSRVRTKTTLTLLQAVEVLAVDGSVDRVSAKLDQSNSIQTVTLAVTPSAANALVLAKGQGQLQLALRLADEQPGAETPERATLEKLLGVDTQAGPPAPPKPIVAEVWRGGSREELQFNATDGRAIRRGQGGSSPAPAPEVPSSSAPNRVPNRPSGVGASQTSSGLGDQG